MNISNLSSNNAKKLISKYQAKNSMVRNNHKKLNNDSITNSSCSSVNSKLKYKTGKNKGAFQSFNKFSMNSTTNLLNYKNKDFRKLIEKL